MKGPTDKARLDADRKSQPKTKIVMRLLVPNGACFCSNSVCQPNDVTVIDLHHIESRSTKL